MVNSLESGTHHDPEEDVDTEVAPEKPQQLEEDTDFPYTFFVGQTVTYYIIPKRRGETESNFRRISVHGTVVRIDYVKRLVYVLPENLPLIRGSTEIDNPKDIEPRTP